MLMITLGRAPGWSLRHDYFALAEWITADPAKSFQWYAKLVRHWNCAAWTPLCCKISEADRWSNLTLSVRYRPPFQGSGFLGSQSGSQWLATAKGADQTFANALAAAISEVIDVTPVFSCESLILSSGRDADRWSASGAASSINIPTRVQSWLIRWMVSASSSSAPVMPPRSDGLTPKSRRSFAPGRMTAGLPFGTEHWLIVA